MHMVVIDLSLGFMHIDMLSLTMFHAMT